MKFEHVSFNEGFWKGKTESQFIEHESHHGLTVNQLKEAFQIINPVKKNQSVNTGKASKKAD